MKKIKKALAVLLALAMVMAMSLTAFAAEETPSATVSVTGADGTAYKYMQLVKEDRDSVDGWEFVNETIATAFISAYQADSAEDAIAKLIASGQIENVKNNSYATAGTVNPSAALGAALAALKDNADQTPFGEGVTSVGLAPFGLYMITAAHDDYNYIPMAVYVNTSYDDVAAKAKGTKNEILKDIDNDDDKSVFEGDVVEYTATTSYPYYSKDTEQKTFTATDILTNATYNQDTLVITAGTTTLEKGKDYTVVFETVSTSTQKMVITFNYDDKYASNSVVIKYSVTVGAGAADVNNTITTNFDTDGDSVTVDKVEVKILKVNDEDEKLAGATFAIYEAADKETKEYVPTEAKVYDSKETTTLYLKDVTAKCLAAGAEAITDENGELTFTGLDAQKTYYIKETNAPVGYSLNEYYYLLDNGDEVEDTSDKTYVFDAFANETVVNTKLSALPSTGGIGTTIFTIGGCLIMILAAAMFFMNRRRVEE